MRPDVTWHLLYGDGMARLVLHLAGPQCEVPVPQFPHARGLVGAGAAAELPVAGAAVAALPLIVLTAEAGGKQLP